MQREEKSERSRRQVLDTALLLFSHQGYRTTTMREIADKAKVSTGNVDVIEFDGTHIRKFYGEMATRFADLLAREGTISTIAQRLRVSPVSALMITTRIFFSYFTIEILFNVPEPFGKDSETVVKEIADILRNGILQERT